MVIDKIRKVSNSNNSNKNTKASDMLIGKWVKCDSCKEILYKEDVKATFEALESVWNEHGVYASSELHFNGEKI